MKQLSHVVWNEGMHLAQHHFQAQSRFFEDAIQFALSNLFYKAYGLVACEIDADALKNDTVSLVFARGIMPDGTPFDIPGADQPLKPLAIRDRFQPASESHLVLLALPAYRPEQANVASGDTSSSLRYSARSVMMRDEVGGRDERPVTLGSRNFSLLLDNDVDAASRAGLVVLPVARVRRDGAGHFMLDPDYIAPSLHIGASTRLLTMVQRIVEMLDAKADAIARGRRGSSDEFAQREVASFWLLHTIHASQPALRAFLQARRIHPERLYIEMARLAGALCTFSLDMHPRSLPAYDHDDPEPGFAILDHHIREHFEVVAPTSRSAIPLIAAGDGLHVATVSDARAFGSARWIIGVRSSLPANEIVARVPVQARVCSGKFVLELVRRSFPGLRLDHLPTPPAQIAPRPDMQYFDIERAGPCWDSIVASHEVGAHVSDTVPDAQFELNIILD